MEGRLVLGLIFLSLFALSSCAPPVLFSPPVVSFSSQSLDWESGDFVLKDSGIGLNFEMKALGFDPKNQSLDIGLSYELKGLKAEDMIFYLAPGVFDLFLTSSVKLD